MNHNLYYRMTDAGGVEPCSMTEWAEAMNGGREIIKQDQVGEYWISTVFLGLDHGFDQCRPILFETMVFRSTPESRKGRLSGAWHDLDGDRYALRDEALEGHARFVDMARTMGAEWVRAE